MDELSGLDRALSGGALVVQDDGTRQLFADRFSRLLADAGRPKLDQLAREAQRHARPDVSGRVAKLSRQKISAWKVGTNLPTQFEHVAPVLGVLIGQARRRSPAPTLDGLYDMRAWRAIWEQAAASPASPSTETGPNGPAGTIHTREVGTDDRICPYRGLAPFEAEHAAFFRGRDESVRILVDAVSEISLTGGLLMLVAPSGAGKSSLLRAGLVPALRAGVSQPLGGDSASWPILVVTPGQEPLGELTQHIRGLADIRTEPVDQFADHVRILITKYAEQRSQSGARLILVVDQFEELFTMCDEETERQAFIAVLQAASYASERATAPALIVLGLRADFYSRCLAYPQLAEALQKHQIVLGPMTAQELKEAITAPAEAAGLRVDPRLTELVLQEAGVSLSSTQSRGRAAYEAGLLPLLSHALRATWQHRQSGRLTVGGYRAGGGIHGAISLSADRALASLNTDGQNAAMSLLLKLTRIGEDTQDTRRRWDKEQLLSHCLDRDAAQRALEVLVRERLVSVDTDKVQLTHEALLQAWPRLRGWIEQHRADLLLRQHVEEDATTWERHRRDTSLLYRGARLETAQEWAEKAEVDGPSSSARAFLEVSARHRSRSMWAIRGGIALIVVLALFASAAAVVATRQRDDAVFGEVIAQADRLQEIDPSLSAQLDLVAHRMRPDDPAVHGRVLSTQNAPLASTLPGRTGAVYFTAFSPDGRSLVVATFGRAVQLWNLADRGHPKLSSTLLAGTSWISSVVFSPDGRTLAAAGGDGTLRLWNVTDPQAVTAVGPPLASHNGSIIQLAFSPNGGVLAAAHTDHTVRLWNVTDPAHPAVIDTPLTGPSGSMDSVAFSPDGHTLAAGSFDSTVWLWDVTDPTHPTVIGPPLTGHRGPVDSVAFSPDGLTLATGSWDKTAQLWNVTEPAHPAVIGPPLIGHSSRIWSVAFSPDGHTLATGSSDGSVRVWNITDVNHPKPLVESLRTTAGGVEAIAFSPDGHTLSAGCEDGTTLLWSLPPTILTDDIKRVYAISFSSDGHTLATGNSDKAVRLWNVTDSTHPARLGPSLIGDTGYQSDALAFRSDGRILATQSNGRILRLWDISDSRQPKLLGKPIEQNTQNTHLAAISRDGRTLATGDTDSTVRLWNIANPAYPLPLGEPLTGHTTWVNSARFSPDGRTLATAGSDGTIRLWDVGDPAHARFLAPPLDPHAGQVLQAVFSPDGHALASTGEDGTVVLWNVTDPAAPARTGQLAGNGKVVTSVAFSPDGRTVAVGSNDRTIRLWTVTDPARPAPGPRLAGHSGTVDSVAFSPSGQTLASASEDDTVRLWDLSIEHAIRRICVDTQGTLTREQWQQTIPQLPYNPPCT